MTNDCLPLELGLTGQAVCHGDCDAAGDLTQLKIPSSRASLLAVSIAYSFETASTRSTTDKSRVCGIMPGRSPESCGTGSSGLA